MSKTLLKKSRFNYISQMENGDFILCNFAKGLSSFCKVESKDAELFNSLWNSDRIEYSIENKSYVDQFVVKGILVPYDWDEMITVTRLYYEAALDNQARIIIMPTEQCNFRCKYCYENYKKGRMSEENQVSLLKFIQKQINNTNRLHLSWFGGEPLEAIDIVCSVMEKVNLMCSKRKVQLFSDMTTNAYNLNPETFDTLYNLGVRSFQITVDGLEEQHNKLRVLKDGSGTFSTIVSNLLYIKNNYEKYKYVTVSVRVNMGVETLEKFSEFISFYREKFGNDKRFELGLTPINDMGGNSIKQIDTQLIDSAKIYRELQKLNIYQDTSINLANFWRAFLPEKAICYASRKNTYVIGSDLSLYKCTVHFEMEENNIGHISSNGDPVVNEDYHQRWYTNGFLRDKCKNCFMLPCCFGGGCPHKRNFTNLMSQKCVLTSWKKELKNAIRYIALRMNIESINFDYIGEGGVK